MTKKEEENNVAAMQGQAFHPGSLVWASPKQHQQGKSGNASWLRGIVQSVSRGADDVFVLEVKFEDDNVVSMKASDCFLQNERDDTLDDLVRSDFLHEPGILHTLRVRYELDSIYTYSGQILIAVNPHKELKHLYGARMMAQYRGIPFGDLSPHTYAIAEAAYNAMMIDEQRQAILISGESGAGKTESAKMVMQYLAHRAGPGRAGLDAGIAAPIEQQVLESNPLLEAFGNAKTLRNHNSSRFGKFVEIDFDATGKVIGACISTYLLERSRVVSVDDNERSFHIFYQICAGADEDLRRDLKLPEKATDFQYLAQSNTITLDTIDDVQSFRDTLHAMHVIGLSPDQVRSVLRCVGAVLHLGNVNFETAPNASADEAILKSDDGTEQALAAAASLLGVPTEDLGRVLMTRNIRTVNETILKKFNVEESTESRDALAKSLYSRLFDWLVQAVNRKIGYVGGSERTSRTVGILDIYGFESFDTNSFEQLCINLANEKLQQAFNAHVFKAEQEEYSSEGIKWSYIEFVDNQDVLDLLEGSCVSPITQEKMGTKCMGIFPMIDEACRLPRATSQNLAISLRETLDRHPRFSAPRRDQYSFIVDHYAGEVRYATDALLEKNRDFVIEDQEALMRSGHGPLPRELFSEAAAKDQSSKQSSSFKLNTIGHRFRKQLVQLAKTLNECQPHFIRCIKPNEASSPGQLDAPYAMEQLRAGGVLEAVRIACAGFPTRKPFFAFVRRYYILLSSRKYKEVGIEMTQDGFIDWDMLSIEQLSAITRLILQNSQLQDWQIGRSKVFLRTGQLAILEGLRGRVLTDAVIRIQCGWRSYIARKNFIRTVQSIVLIQSAWRTFQAVLEANKRRQELSATLIQSYWRTYMAQRHYIELKRDKSAVVIQSNWRRYCARSGFLKQCEYARRQAEQASRQETQKEAAIVIQSYWRRFAAHLLFKQRASERAFISNLQEERNAFENYYNELKTAKEAADVSLASAFARIATLESELAQAQTEILALQGALDAAQANSGDLEKVYQSIHDLEKAHEVTIRSMEEEIATLQNRIQDSSASLVDAQNALSEKERKLDELNAKYEDLKSSKTAQKAALALQLDEARHALTALQDTTAAAKMATTTAELSRISELEKALKDSQMKIQDQENIMEQLRNQDSIKSNRIQALQSRVERNEQRTQELLVREKELQDELQVLRYQQKESTTPVVPRSIPMEEAIGGPRALYSDLDAAASPMPAAPAPGEPCLNADKSAAVETIISHFVQKKTELVTIKGVAAQHCLPYASWIIHRCLAHWLISWNEFEIAAAVDDIVRAAAFEASKGLNNSIYWFQVTLVCGSMLRASTVGRKHKAAVATANKLMGCTSVHMSLGDKITDLIPIRIQLLLSEDMRKSVMSKTKRFDTTDPFGILGPSKDQWKAIVGGLTNLTMTLKDNHLPMPAIRAVVWATLRYIDGELLNGILLRRDYCSVSTAKALRVGLVIVRNNVLQLADTIDLDLTEQQIEYALERSNQAAYFLMDGFDDYVRKAKGGIDITGDLRKSCRSLSLEQITRLSNYRHHDLLENVSSTTIHRKVLLETLKRISLATPRLTTQAPSKQLSPSKSWVSFSGMPSTPGMEEQSGENPMPEELGGEDFLVDSLADFNMFYSNSFTNKALMDAGKVLILKKSGTTSGSPGPLLPNGTLPQRSPGGSIISQGSFFGLMNNACSSIPIPSSVLMNEELQFLGGTPKPVL